MAGMNPFMIAVILVCLAVVDCVITIARRVAVGLQSATFHQSNVLLLNEIIKLVFCCVQVFLSMRKGESARTRIRQLLSGSIYMIPVCVLYLIANIVSYPSLQRVPANVFAALSQLKVLTTAFFTVTLLKAKVSLRRWRTMLTLMLGVVVVMLGKSPQDIAEPIYSGRYYFGAFLGFLQTCLTGLACVILELLLKSREVGADAPKFDIWERNVQLAIWSIIIYIPLAFKENDGRLLLNWTRAELLISFLHALGGILVALSILHASSIAKTIAVSAGLVATSLLGGLFGDLPPSPVAIIGGAIVTVSILVYRDDIELERQQML